MIDNIKKCLISCDWCIKSLKSTIKCQYKYAQRLQGIIRLQETQQNIISQSKLNKITATNIYSFGEKKTTIVQNNRIIYSKLFQKFRKIQTYKCLCRLQLPRFKYFSYDYMMNHEIELWKQESKVIIRKTKFSQILYNEKIINFCNNKYRIE